MRKTIITSVIGLLLMVAASLAYGASGNVSSTLHNLSAPGTPFYKGPAARAYYAGSVSSGGETQVCVFCHTPHNAAIGQPLWNRATPTSTFNMYTSASLTSVARAVNAPGGESLMCLSCHDGVSALNVVHNMPTGTGTPAGSLTIAGSNLVPMISGLPTTIGKDLTNDHPISFSYAAAQAETPTKLNDINTAKLKGIRFSGPNGDMIECSSCHDPHVAYGNDSHGNSIGGDPSLRPFLRVTNNGSQLCFACHNK